MLDIREVADKTYLFEAPVVGVERILSVYLIAEEKGAIIDPGPASASPFILEAINRLGMKDVSYIIPTHIHVDHAGAIGELAGVFPNAKVILHPTSVKHAIDPSRLIQGTKMTFGDDFEKTYGVIAPVPEAQIAVPQDGEKVSLGGRELRIFYAPGHAPHHIAIFDEKTRGIFSGEALGVPRKGAELFPLPGVAPPSFDMDAYMETVDKLQKLNPCLIFYGHDGVGTRPDILIPKVKENVKAVGDIILKGLKEGREPREIGRMINEYVLAKTGFEPIASDRTMTVDAYSMYFKRKGLI